MCDSHISIEKCWPKYIRNSQNGDSLSFLLHYLAGKNFDKEQPSLTDYLLT